MSDEAMESVPGLKPIQYTAKHYALYLGKMVELTAKLNKGEGNNGDAKFLLHLSVLSLLLMPPAGSCPQGIPSRTGRRTDWSCVCGR